MKIPPQLAGRARPARGEPSGALILLHGRGADDNDLFPLLDVLDPWARLAGVTPRAPLQLPPGGYHWYKLGEVGAPDPGSFLDSASLLGAWLDEFWDTSGIPAARTFIGGFSQGAVMAHTMTLMPGRPRPAGLLAFSGYIPRVDGLALDPGAAEGLPVAIGHGSYDQVIGVEMGRAARDTLEEAGADIVYTESPMPHTIDPEFLKRLAGWIEEKLP